MCMPDMEFPEPPPVPGPPAETAATSRANQDASEQAPFASIAEGMGMSSLRIPINRNIGGY